MTLFDVSTDELFPTPARHLGGRGRVLVWFSCGAASAVAAKMALEQYRDQQVEVVYCDTSASEHPDNLRFLADVERWIGQPVIRITSGYQTIYDAFRSCGFLTYPHRNGSGPCTDLMKRRPRKLYQTPYDVHIFGFTVEERDRMESFIESNPSLRCAWPLIHHQITRADCYAILAQAGIDLPAMYLLGYRNNNCIGCVKGGAGYWNKIRVDFPDAFARMAALERELGFALLKHRGAPCFLDELPPDAGNYKGEDMSCGPQCVWTPSP